VTRRGALIVVIVLATFGLLGNSAFEVDTFLGLQHTAMVNHRNTQQSRIDSAYISCLYSNNGNKHANTDILRFIAHPDSTDRRALIDDLRPLRSSNAVQIVPLPSPLPKAWVKGCTAYARAQIKINPPAGLPLPTG
jgi:hypothetical protein